MNTLGSRSPKLQSYDLKRIAQKMQSLFRSTKNSVRSTPVSIVQPFVLPFYDSHAIRRLNYNLLSRLIRRKISEMSFERPILMSGTPLSAEIVGTVGETSSHYFCTDDYVRFDGVFRAFESMERLMIDKVDCMFATSELLLRTRPPRFRQGIFLPQGVDTEHFSVQKDKIPQAMRDMSGPIVGFFGMIASWIDVDLIVRCARKYPGVSFVLIGKLGVDDKFLKASQNIRYLGEVLYEELPCYAQAFNVGLIPFIKNDLTVAANPLKMLEYLSLGMPVVSSDLPEVRKFRDVVHVATSDKEFIDNIGIALEENSQHEKAVRRQRAEEFSWTAIVERISSTVIQIENEKQHKGVTSSRVNGEYH